MTAPVCFLPPQPASASAAVAQTAVVTSERAVKKPVSVLPVIVVPSS